MIAEDAIRFDNLDEAIIGSDHRGLIVYDYNKLVQVFCKMDMTEEEAVEWIDFNVLGVNAGNGFTVLMDNKELVMEQIDL